MKNIFTPKSSALLIGSIACLGVVLSASPALAAGSAASNLEISAEVASSCTINAGAVVFGAYDPIVTNSSAALVASGTITVTCTSGSQGLIELDEGASPAIGSAPAAPLREMLANTSDKLAYALFSDSGRILPWATGEAVDVPHTGTGASAELTVYGSVAAGQNVPVGTYLDTVVATITF